MTRSTYIYPPTTSEALQAVLAYHDEAVRYLKDPSAPEPDLTSLLQGLPQGPLMSARVIPATNSPDALAAPAIAFTIKDRSERTIDPEGFLTLRGLELFGMGLHIDKNMKEGEDRRDYIEVGSEGGITLMRLLADAQQGEVVRQQADHHDLRATALAITRGKDTVVRGRREALAEALRSYDHHALRWGISSLLSRVEYQALVRGSFRLFDINHGHVFLRPLRGAD